MFNLYDLNGRQELEDVNDYRFYDRYLRKSDEVMLILEHYRFI